MRSIIWRTFYVFHIPAVQQRAPPNPDFHFNADPDPTFYSDADPDPTFLFDSDPDPTNHNFPDIIPLGNASK